MYKEIPIEVKIREILDLLEGKQYLCFSEIIKLQPSRTAMVVSFMALLELVKNKQIVAKQSELFEDIRLYRIYRNEQEETDEKQELNLDIKQDDNVIKEDAEVQQQPENLELEAETISSSNNENNEDNNGN